MEADRPVHWLRPELHAARGTVPPGRVGVVFDVRGAASLAAAAAVVIAIHEAGAREGSPQNILKRRVLGPHGAVRGRKDVRAARREKRLPQEWLERLGDRNHVRVATLG